MNFAESKGNSFMAVSIVCSNKQALSSCRIRNYSELFIDFGLKILGRQQVHSIEKPPFSFNERRAVVNVI